MTDPLHNNPPEAVEIFKERLDRLAENIAAVDVIESEEQNAAAADLVNVARNLAKEADAERAELKKPHLEAGRAVDQAFKPIVDRAQDVTKPLRVKMAAFIKEQKRKADEEARKLREEAERKAAEAEALKDDDLVGDIVAEEAAEAKTDAAVAKVKAKQASQARGQGGRAMSVRTTYDVEVTDAVALVENFKGTQAVIDLCTDLARRQVRAMKGDISLPGIQVTKSESVQ